MKESSAYKSFEEKVREVERKYEESKKEIEYEVRLEVSRSKLKRDKQRLALSYLEDRQLAGWQQVFKGFYGEYEKESRWLNKFYRFSFSKRVLDIQF